MAFPIPDHLPRGQDPTLKTKKRDLSTEILTKISSATDESLDAELAGSWITELDGAITETKDKIYQRALKDRRAFDQHLQGAVSIQERFSSVKNDGDQLENGFSDAESGLRPNLLRRAAAHAALAQEALNARKLAEAFASLQVCYTRHAELSSSVAAGKLAEAARLSASLDESLEGAAEGFKESSVFLDFKRQARILRDKIQEQLSDAYSKCVRVTSTSFILCPAVQLQPTYPFTPLSDVLSSLSSTSLSSHLSTLRRDIIAHFIEGALTIRCVAGSISPEKDPHGVLTHTLSISPMSPSDTPADAPLTFLATLFDFLISHLTPHLPHPSQISFPQSLCKPATAAILTHLIKPAIPHSLALIPTYLSLLNKAVEFEEDTLGELFGDNDSEKETEKEIRGWVVNVGSHYGRHRRTVLLEQARELILEWDAGPARPPVRMELRTDAERDDENVDSGSFKSGIDLQVGEEGLNEVRVEPQEPVTPLSSDPSLVDEVEDDGAWGFEDDADGAPSEDSPVEPSVAQEAATAPADIKAQEASAETDEDPSDAWGWNDGLDEEPPTEEDVAGHDGHLNGDGHMNGHGHGTESEVDTDASGSSGTAWDDPWDEPPEPQLEEEVKIVKPVRVAKGLQKKFKGSAKTRTQDESKPTEEMLSPSSITSSRTVDASSQTNPNANLIPNLYSAPSSSPPKPVETYMMPGNVDPLARLVEDILMEAEELRNSNLFGDFVSIVAPGSSANASVSSFTTWTSSWSLTSTPPATLISQAAGSVLDLFRALHPEAYGSTSFTRPETGTKGALMQMNACVHLSREIKKFIRNEELRNLLREPVERLRRLGEGYSEKIINQQKTRIMAILDRAGGFVGTMDEDRFDECEGAVTEVLQVLKSESSSFKTALPTSQALPALGRIVDATLCKVLNDILALVDIEAAESRRLAELCRIFSALEGIFADPSGAEEGSMVVAYVPSWLKFSYLSELLEASLADISYLFDEGALVDFGIPELVPLVCALFADTPMRANAIARIERGHPVQEQYA